MNVHRWPQDVRLRATAALSGFASERRAEYFSGAPGDGFVTGLLGEYLAGGGCLPSTFAYAGWLAGGAGDSDAALHAASTELLHASALLQGDLTARPAARRGPPRARRLAHPPCSPYTIWPSAPAAGISEGRDRNRPLRRNGPAPGWRLPPGPSCGRKSC